MHLPSSDKERWSSAGERVEEGEKIKDGSKKKLDNSCGKSEHIGNLHTLQAE